MATPALDLLISDLRTICADRLHAVVVYGTHAAGPGQGPVHTLVLLDRVELADLDGCARRRTAWTREGLETPLLLGRDEFVRSLDAFPLEFGAILAHHRVVLGPDPFAGLTVDERDLRRACEVEVKGHLLHLRESYLEAGGDPDVLTEIVQASAPALQALLEHLARLAGEKDTSQAGLGAFIRARLGPAHAETMAGVLAQVEAPVMATDAARLFPDYLAAMDALAREVDAWHA